jgi:hypothetical protein
VVLDEKSRSKLLEFVSSYVPHGWETIAHHMTINMGEIKPEYEKYLGMTVPLRVVGLGMTDKVMAMKVEGFPTDKNVPHITVAVNRKDGGKPFMSNKINDWRPIQFSLKLKGKVEEVPR